MDPRKWLPSLPLFKSVACVYCGAPANSTDHSPPRCLLPRNLPDDFQVITVPACSGCNGQFSEDEARTAAIVSTVSFLEEDRIAVAPGGRIYRAMARDASLRKFIGERINRDGTFQPDASVLNTISRVMKKTAVGLPFHEFGRVVALTEIELLGIEHSRNINRSAAAESWRLGHPGWAEVTASGWQLERQAVALLGVGPPPHMPEWRSYVPRFFEYLFLRRSSDTLLAAFDLHDALTVVMESPWPSRSGPRRKGRAPKG